MTDYLPHDIDAADDARLQELQMEMRGQGYAIWWRLLELLWKNEGRLPYKPALLAYNIRWCTAEEVERVITGFDLFVVQDGQFWSESLLRRIGARNAKGKEISDQNRRNANARWHREDAAAEDNSTPEDATAMRPQCDGNATAMQNDAYNTTQHYTTDNSLSLSLAAKAEGARTHAPAREREGEDRERNLIFLRFFFKNFKDPAGEMERYWDNYAGQGWKTSKGAPIEDKVAYCSGWKPLDTSPRFGKNALNWYENFYNDAAPDFKDPFKLLTDLTEITRDGDQIILRYTSKTTAQKVANWRSGHGGYAAVAVQVATKRQPTPNPLP